MPIDLHSIQHREDDVPHQRTMPTERGPIEHRVKSWPHLFASTLSGEKKHELRRISDRDYRVGDFLLLQEFDPTTQCYSGRELRVKITYITSAESPCALSKSALNPEFCILSIEKV
jgi:Domain of unknown function (DUF3850)